MASSLCASTAGCLAFALDPSWDAEKNVKLFGKGQAVANGDWTLYTKT